jgi:hypothetical protein
MNNTAFTRVIIQLTIMVVEQLFPGTVRGFFKRGRTRTPVEYFNAYTNL